LLAPAFCKQLMGYFLANDIQTKILTIRQRKFWNEAQKKDLEQQIETLTQLTVIEQEKIRIDIEKAKAELDGEMCISDAETIQLNDTIVELEKVYQENHEEYDKTLDEYQTELDLRERNNAWCDSELDRLFSEEIVFSSFDRKVLEAYNFPKFMELFYPHYTVIDWQNEYIRNFINEMPGITMDLSLGKEYFTALFFDTLSTRDENLLAHFTKGPIIEEVEE
jgi:hypothetical protein